MIIYKKEIFYYSLLILLFVNSGCEKRKKTEDIFLLKKISSEKFNNDSSALLLWQETNSLTSNAMTILDRKVRDSLLYSALEITELGINSDTTYLNYNMYYNKMYILRQLELRKEYLQWLNIMIEKLIDPAQMTFLIGIIYENEGLYDSAESKYKEAKMIYEEYLLMATSEIEFYYSKYNYARLFLGEQQQILKEIERHIKNNFDNINIQLENNKKVYIELFDKNRILKQWSLGNF